MTDIVERLRKLADRERPYGTLPDTLDEAAVEIGRLRNVLENAQQARVLQGKAIIDAANEIERLRAALKLIADGKETEPRILASAMLEGKHD